MSNQLKSFLTILGEDPDVLADFHADPEATLAANGIDQADDFAALRENTGQNSRQSFMFIW